jgi:hypothetical protein
MLFLLYGSFPTRTSGHTAQTAGSAEQFIKVDLEYVKLTAEAAKAGGTTRHFSLLTAQGANAGMWASHL